MSKSICAYCDLVIEDGMVCHKDATILICLKSLDNKHRFIPYHYRPTTDNPINSNLPQRVKIMTNETKQITYPTTTYSQFDEFFDNFIEECRKMRDTKGKEYAGDRDRFDNFNRLALKNDIDRLKVANIYLGKHLDAIDSYIREGKIFSTESIRGRFIDAVTYLILMAGMAQSINNACEHKPFKCNLYGINHFKCDYTGRVTENTVIVGK